MQVKERTFDFIRNGNRVTEIREGGRTLASLRENRLTGSVELVQRNGEVITFEMGKRPLVQALAGSPTPVIGGFVPTVNKIILPGGKETSFDFGTDEGLLPTLSIVGEEQGQPTTSVWNSRTGLIVKDGDWTYEIEPAENPRHNAAIGRANFKGQKEFWHRDSANGIESALNAGGTKKTTRWFTSGKLAGKIRSITIEDERKDAYKLTYSYDDHGRIFRKSNGQLTVCFDLENRPTIIEYNGQIAYTYHYDLDGKLNEIKASKEFRHRKTNETNKTDENQRADT